MLSARATATWLGRRGLMALVHRLDVAARAERVAVAGDHHDANLGVGRHHGQRAAEAGVHRLGQRVAAVGSVEGDHADLAVDVGEEVVGAGVEFSDHAKASQVKAARTQAGGSPAITSTAILLSASASASASGFRAVWP